MVIVVKPKYQNFLNQKYVETHAKCIQHMTNNS
jgi:hypothetical protein